LGWLDQILLWLEDFLIKIWRWLKSLWTNQLNSPFINQAIAIIKLFWEYGGDRIKVYSLKSRGGIWLSHAQPIAGLSLSPKIKGVANPDPVSRVNLSASRCALAVSVESMSRYKEVW
jgi:hypothetical protein